jgi:hypothetical protein
LRGPLDKEVKKASIDHCRWCMGDMNGWLCYHTPRTDAHLLKLAILGPGQSVQE